MRDATASVHGDPEPVGKPRETRRPLAVTAAQSLRTSIPSTFPQPTPFLRPTHLNPREGRTGTGSRSSPVPRAEASPVPRRGPGKHLPCLGRTRSRPLPSRCDYGGACSPGATPRGQLHLRVPHAPPLSPEVSQPLLPREDYALGAKDFQKHLWGGAAAGDSARQSNPAVTHPKDSRQDKGRVQRTGSRRPHRGAPRTARSRAAWASPPPCPGLHPKAATA